MDSSPEVCETPCSNCTGLVNFYKDQVETLIKEIEDVKYEKYTLWKTQKPLKAKLEAQTSDYRRIQQEYSEKSALLTFAYEDIARLTTELEELKAKYVDADFSFKKFDVSSAVVENMIANHLKFVHENKTKQGLGYNSVPPPFNDNYTPPLETSEFEPYEYVGKPLTTDSVVIDKSNKSDSKPAEATNVTNSCAGKQEKKKEEKKVVKEVEAEKEKKEEKKKEKKEKKKQDDIGSSSAAPKTTDLVSDEPKTPENHNIKLTVLVEPVVKCCCSCECINTEKTTPTSTKSTSSGPEPSQEPHIEIDCHFTRHHLEKGTISLPFVSSTLQIADMFTKPLTAPRFQFLTDKLLMLTTVAL